MEVQKPGDSSGAYRKEIQEGTKIFEKSFKGMESAKFDAQKAEFQKSTEESLQAIQDACKGLANDHLNKLKDQLTQDYQAYLQNPDKAHEQKVEKDIEDLKGSS